MFGKKVNTRIKVQHGKKKLEHKEEAILELKALKGAHSSSFGAFPSRLGCWMGARKEQDTVDIQYQQTMSIRRQ